MKDYKNINLKISRDMWLFLKKASALQERSMTTIIAECINKYKNKLSNRLTDSEDNVQLYK